MSRERLVVVLTLHVADINGVRTFHSQGCNYKSYYLRYQTDTALIIGFLLPQRREEPERGA